MMKRIFIAVSLLVVLCGATPAQPAASQTKDEAFPASPQVVPLFIMTKEKGEWLIAAFQNTKAAPPQSASR
jgi:hypothetical protein